MAVEITKRVSLVVQTQGIIVAGMGDKVVLVPWTEGSKLEGMSRMTLTKSVEAVLARLSSAAFKAGTRPMHWQVLINAPQRLEYGFQHYGLQITWPAPAPVQVAPNPKATPARKARKVTAR